MSALLNRVAKYTSEREFELLRPVLSKGLKDMDKATLKRRIGILRRYADKAREKAIAEARKGESGELSRRKAEIFREALRRGERRLLDIEVKEARQRHRAAARSALEKKSAGKTGKRPRPGRTASRGIASKPRTSPVPRLTAGREKGHVLAVQRRSQAKRDKR
ncbi:MAG: hypothetical protein GY791_09350 [Alphaproteobacteria bacterium]|nr:hypothetical protein [Alphaproteobacteria bacterium]